MEATFAGIARTIKVTERSEQDRLRGMNKAIDSMKRLSCEAISLEASYHAELACADRHLADGNERAHAMSVIRAKTLHEDRCRAIQRVASYARMVVLDASGALGIDETTACTGLDELDRRMVSEVTGRCSRW